ncbi:hypothetical protein [Streptomyces sp. NPDC054961]
MVLTPPLAPMPAQATETLPAPATAGSLAYEQTADRHPARNGPRDAQG